jgi:glyoxylase-like metal-dependent hydrolase (beta-lactamase superfamily II)
MRMHAEPQLASLPLPGGRDGATVRLRPLLTGTGVAPATFFHRETGRLAAARALGVIGGESARTEVPIPAFLIEHPSAGLVLVDTGLHPSVAVDPKENMGRLNSRFLQPRMEASQAVPAQLRARGMEASQVHTVLMTHLHSDHASAVSEFPGATFLFSLQEWESATTISRPAVNGYMRRQFDHAFDYRTIDFEAGDIDSFATFGRSVDVFGDGSVRLAFTPGHTLGHLSVIVRLRSREVLLTADAAYTRRTIEDDVLPHRMLDEHLFRRSLREIQLYAEQTPDALIVPGHDMGAWGELEAVYE